MARCIRRMQIGVEGSVRYRVRSIGDFGSPRSADICFARRWIREKVDADLPNFGSTFLGCKFRNLLQNELYAHLHQQTVTI